MSLRLELCDFTPEPVDLQLLGLHLTVPRKRLLRIYAKFLHPFANNVLVDVEVPRRLSHAYASLTHQAYRLDLDSQLNLRLCIACLRLPETPYLGVHGTGSRPPGGDLAGFALKLLLFESVDEFDGGEEPYALAVMLDGLDADRGGEMRLARAGATDHDDIVGRLPGTRSDEVGGRAPR